MPAIAVSAYARGEDSDLALEAGYDLHVSKPLDLEELVESVASLVTRTAGRRRNPGDS